MTAPDLPAASFLAAVYVLERPIRPSSIKQLVISLRALELFHGRTLTLGDLSDDLINRWLVSMEGVLSGKTIKRRRGDVLAIWRYAFEAGYIQTQPGRIRKVVTKPRIPEAWTLDEVKLLIHAAQQLDDYFPWGVHRGLWWEAYIRAGYDTALRLSDLLRLERCWVSSAGEVRMVQEKTGDCHRCRLRPETLAVLDRTFPPSRRLAFPWEFSREQFFYAWRGIVKMLPNGRRFGPNRLRHTSASHLARIAPGHVQGHLGHRSETLARRHYVDPTIADDDRPLPPEI